MRGINPSSAPRAALQARPVRGPGGWDFQPYLNGLRGRRLPQAVPCFVRWVATKQTSGGTKPFSYLAKTSGNGCWVSINLIKRRAKKAQWQGTVMIKALSAVAIAAFVAAALTILPGFAPQVEASVPQALAKGDRLDIHTAGPTCSQKAWPNFEASCLRVAGSKIMIREARLVTADRAQEGRSAGKNSKFFDLTR